MSQVPKESENRFGRISDLDDSDKPREKALTHGIRSLSNAELLAIVFGSGLPGKSVINLSQEILASCGNRLSRLSRMSIHEVVKNYNGIGPAKAISLAAAFELGCRCRDEQATEDPLIRDSNSVYEIMRGKLERLNHEEFWVLMLSRSNRVIYEYQASRGGTANTVVDIKLLMKKAIDLLASTIVLVHNHPSGNSKPSIEDDRLTQRIKDAAQFLEIKLLDHIIITPSEYYSYNDEARL